MLRTVHLYGPLEQLAKTSLIELDVDTPVDLINGLRSQIKGFRRWCDQHKLALILTDEENNATSLDTSDFALSIGKATDVHLVPETEGAGVEVIAWISTTLAVSTTWATVIYIAANIAIAMVMGAIAQALSPAPEMGGEQQRAEERPSFIYSGAVNRVEQGHAVPIIYGKHMTGSIVVSAGIRVEEIPF